jgi:hypothetical protein
MALAKKETAATPPVEERYKSTPVRRRPFVEYAFLFVQPLTSDPESSWQVDNCRCEGRSLRIRA